MNMRACLTWFFFFSLGFTGTLFSQSEDKRKIEGRMIDVSNDVVVMFDKTGDEVKRFTLGRIDTMRFPSLAALIQRVGLARLGVMCKDPKPTPPPPQCVICPDGYVICTKAKFGGAVVD